MKYELRAHVFVDDLSDLDDVLDKLDDCKDKMIVVNPGIVGQECSRIDVIENHHDEDVHAGCNGIVHWDNCPSP